MNTDERRKLLELSRDLAAAEAEIKRAEQAAILVQLDGEAAAIARNLAKEALETFKKERGL